MLALLRVARSAVLAASLPARAIAQAGRSLSCRLMPLAKPIRPVPAAKNGHAILEP